MGIEPLGELALEQHSLVDLAVSRLRAEILSGAIEPGERLIEEQLTRRFGISRAPLREALRLLAQQGLVEHLPRRGVRVATLSDRDVLELYGLRDVLERHALEIALPVADGQELAALREALDEMRVAAGVGDRLAVATAHRGFHLAVVALAKQRQLSLVFEPVLLKLQLYMAVNLRREAEFADPADNVRRHERLYDTILTGDTFAVLRQLSDHGAQSYLSSSRPAAPRRA